MNKHVHFLGAALLAAWLLAGCATDANRVARIQEKSAAYAALKPWQKRYVDRGFAAVGFTADMVYMAAGAPSTKQDTEAGELWIYRNYYPPSDASNFKYPLYAGPSVHSTAGKAGQAQRNETDQALPQNALPNRGQNAYSISTHSPQGGSMEPPDLPSYQLLVLFRDGKVAKIGLVPASR